LSGAPAHRSRRVRGGRGLVIDRVAEGSPAAAAGLRRGDLIVAIGGHRVASMNDVETVEQAQLPGQVVGVRAARAGRPRTFKVALGSRPDQAPG
jgi:S1-C subfamily serine protease